MLFIAVTAKELHQRWHLAVTGRGAQSEDFTVAGNVECLVLDRVILSGLRITREHNDSRRLETSRPLEITWARLEITRSLEITRAGLEITWLLEVT